VLQVHLVVSSRCTRAAQNTRSDLFFPDTPTGRNTCGHWSMQICHLLGAMRTVLLYVLDQTISLESFSQDSTRRGTCLCWAYHTATHMQPVKLVVFDNKFVPLRSVAKYIRIYSAYTAVTGANTVLAMGEVLVKEDFSGIADTIPQLRIDFNSRMV